MELEDTLPDLKILLQIQEQLTPNHCDTYYFDQITSFLLFSELSSNSLSEHH